MPEFKILNNILDYMESKGLTYKSVVVTINEELVEEVNTINKSSHTLEELQKAADKCFAHEWLKRRGEGGDKYTHLYITPKGIGAARSKQRSEEIKKSRSFLKKTSDYIEEHKGLFIVFGFLLTLATFALKIFGDK
ncbi:hypothetical protein [Pseudoalteromonas carrageenovora]|uniref:hypothetical protein n=1 Tax=Pseudoalteromonas carrageenovora TaxID=227 RepID=UPI0026E24E95|nr:hypothetical protein [Pseudoalteromonas carrageenovora]MDO6464797.1 hypothetical protein [Pseudoalteromonas carrageenovora]